MNFDFEKTLREQAEKCQDENRARLLAAEDVEGGTIEADRVQRGEQPGVNTGGMLADLTRRENIRADASGFKVVPSPEQALKWTVFNAGRKGAGRKGAGRKGAGKTGENVQPPRPVSGISKERQEEIASEIARDARDQLASELRERLT
jgi:hypothetical protein